MEVTEQMEVSVDPQNDDDSLETQLISYLRNILQVQIIPMKFTNLLDLVAEAPKSSRLFDYVQTKYPADTQFLDFLKKYPDIFTVHRNRTVVLTTGNSFTLGHQQKRDRSPDVVDGQDLGEYVSGSDETSDGGDLSDSEERRLIDNPGGDVIINSSVSEEESSVDVFSSQIVQTSDSLASTCSSDSSFDD